MAARVSAGLIMFRGRGETLEVLLVHPGGPFYRNKDAGAWSIPKGEIEPGENLLERARIEFREEVGVAAVGEFLPLGSIRQKGGKTVHTWAFAGDLPPDFLVNSNLFEMEWPPRSGHRQQFPEVDRAEFFSVAEAGRRLNAAQAEFLPRLCDLLAPPADAT